MLLTTTFSFKNILEARFGLKFLGTYRLVNRFLKIGQADYLFQFPDLLEECCDRKAILDCETTPIHAPYLSNSENLHCDMIGLSNLRICPIISVDIGDRSTMLVEPSWWLQYLHLPDDGARTPKLVVDWYFSI